MTALVRIDQQKLFCCTAHPSIIMFSTSAELAMIWLSGTVVWVRASFASDSL
jgi:hypothetical protein